MSLPMLVNGAECGPINPLQGLSKRLDQDRGIQQDFFGAGRAGSSKEAFRTQYSATAGTTQDATRFFSSTQSTLPMLAGSSAFDLSALHTSLKNPQAATQTPPAAAWAADFLQQPLAQAPVPKLTSSTVLRHKDGVFQQESFQQQNLTQSSSAPGFAMWNASPLRHNMGYPAMVPQAFAMPDPQTQAHALQWHQEFQSREASLSSPPAVQTQEPLGAEPQTQSHSHALDRDELARTAGMLVDSVQHEQNSKFQESQFLGLMRQLRDHEIVVEGNQMVQNDGIANQATVDIKGKGRAADVSISYGHSVVPQASTLLSGQATSSDTRTENQVHPDVIDEYLRQENEEYIKYNAQYNWQSSSFSSQRNEPSVQGAEWLQLQHDWEAFEATATGIRPVTHYQFQVNNPYVLGEASRTHNHAMHSETMNSLYEGVLELEAVVQRDPTDALRWYALGVKQQENEREQKAIQALRRSLELDPMHLPSWIALAVSHTNESNRVGAYEAIREWVDRNERYSALVQQFRALNVDPEDATQADHFASLTQCLIEMARGDTSGNIDADIQIALAVLLNTNEDYERAQDCFNVALAVRPDDWLLYNRVGATLANSGHPDEALQYYYRAIELNPAYIRARFNLGIACTNLRRYDEAAQHMLDALVLQDGDSVRDSKGSEDKRGVTSSALWSSLKTCCMHMQRIDLATLCDREDLDAFRMNFQI
ncbi:Peroxisomal targeting signal 1 receptor [Sparassis crispa]|uniref:Peroxisomal targeting signal 1 receptor n=1 Tax=Sparassis crispa TaxID=139825 RepID=A0A401GFQ2_9APHY|nr:Peroxisomal targeting signal 1 receptor [Sparassis crispa]GBE81024.1 Peroxisomal targeting signal 1 receptor [Sparassis crispa]